MLLLLLDAMAFAEEAEAASGFTLREIWDHSGGIARAVIVTLILMFVACIFVGIERIIAFNRARRQSMRLAAEIVGPLQQGEASGGAVEGDGQCVGVAGLLEGLAEYFDEAWSIQHNGLRADLGYDTFELRSATSALEPDAKAA